MVAFDSLPQNAIEFMEWPWSQIEPYYQDLEARPIDASNVSRWLADWTRLSDLASETYARLNVAVTLDTTDPEAERNYNTFLEQTHRPVLAADQRLKEKLLASGLKPDGFEIPLRRMRTETAIFRAENLPLLTEERKLVSAFNRIIGAQSVTWQGQEVTLQGLRKAFESPDRSERESAWRLASERQLADREALNELWGKFMVLRGQLAENAGVAENEGFADYRSYRWKQMLRLDYTPEDCLEFQRAILQVAVPAATRLYESHRQRLGVEALRPWDLDQDLYPVHLPPLPAYGDLEVLQNRAEAIFDQLDAQLGEHFRILRFEGLLDLDNRKGKAPGGYCTAFPVARRPFIFMNAVGLASDVRTLLHESGHAFHNFERFELPYAQQRIPGLEFAEVASMAMELLASPYLSGCPDSLYSETDARRFRLAHLENILLFWPYMAVVDAFQHWVYTHYQAASDPANCDAKWLELWQRYIPGVDWSGLDTAAMTGWQRKQHIFRYPFYYVEYGLAQLGAVQVWRNALIDPAAALASYRQALSLGGTATLPDLYRACGAKLAFDAKTLSEAVQLIEQAISAL